MLGPSARMCDPSATHFVTNCPTVETLVWPWSQSMRDPPEKICGRRLIIFAKGCVILSGTEHGMGEAVVPFQWKGLSLVTRWFSKKQGSGDRQCPRISTRSRERSSANIILWTMLMPRSWFSKISRPISELKSILHNTHIP